MLVIHRLTDNDMVQKLDLKNPAGLANLAGEAKIGFARAGVSGRMIVLCELNSYVIWRAIGQVQSVSDWSECTDVCT